MSPYVERSVSASTAQDKHHPAHPTTERGRRTQQTRADILQVSGGLILTSGTSFLLQDIYNRVGISKTTLLSHYGSRMELMASVLHEGIERSCALMTAHPIGGVHGTGIEAVAHWTHHVLDATRRDPVMLAAHHLLQTPVASEIESPSMYPAWTVHISSQLMTAETRTVDDMTDIASMLTGALAGICVYHSIDDRAHAHRSLHAALVLVVPEVVATEADAEFTRQYLDRVATLAATA